MGVKVDCPDEASLAWLESFLTPHIAVSATADAECFIEVRRGDSEYRDLVESGPAGGDVEVFIFDSRVERLPVWRSSGSQLAVFDEENRLFYLVEEPGRRFVLVSRDDDRVIGRTALMRVVRELAMTHARARGWHLIHGAALSVGARAAVVAGHKGAGKTTLLLYLLTRAGTGLVANDRVAACGEDGSLVLRGIPTIFTVLDSSLDHLPDLGSRLLADAFDFRLLENEIEQRQAFPFTRTPGRKLAFNPTELALRIGTQTVEQAAPAALLFPQVTGESGGLEVESIAPEAATPALRAALFGGVDATRVTEVFVPSNRTVATGEEHLRRFCGELTTQVPAYACRLGTDAYRDGQAARRLTALIGSDPVSQG